MIAISFIVLICFLMYLSVRWLWVLHPYLMPTIRMENFLLLVMTYTILFVGFGLIYFVLEMNGLHVLSENGSIINGSVLHTIESCLYFSAVTLFSVGYGDILPINIGRWISIFEALLGYILPAAFVLRTFIDLDRVDEV